MMPGMIPGMVPGMVPNKMPNFSSRMAAKRSSSSASKQPKRLKRAHRVVQSPSNEYTGKVAVRCYSDPTGSCMEKFDSTYLLICHIANVHNIEKEHACRNCARFSLEKLNMLKQRVEHEKMRCVFQPPLGSNDVAHILISDD